MIKCLPFVGTFVTGCEAIVALTELDGQKFVSKMVQTGVGAAMDTAFVMSGGMSSLVTAPLKVATAEGGKIVLKEVLIKQAGKLTTNVAVRAATEYVVKKTNDDNARYRSRRSIFNILPSWPTSTGLSINLFYTKK